MVLDDSSRPVVFASGGIGITLIVGTLSHLVKAGSHLRALLLPTGQNGRSFARRQQAPEDTAQPTPDLHFEEPDGPLPGTSEVSVKDCLRSYQVCGPPHFVQPRRGARRTAGVARDGPRSRSRRTSAPAACR